jgi:hypothetical protein
MFGPSGDIEELDRGRMTAGTLAEPVPPTEVSPGAGFSASRETFGRATGRVRRPAPNAETRDG